MSVVAAFLLGEGPLQGVWYGERPEGERGKYWWRKHLRAAIASTAQPAAPAAQGDAQQRAMHARNSDNALAEGWKEAAIAWEVCASVHRAWGKGRDALFTTRQADYLRHAQMARERHADLTRPTGEAPGSPSESSHDRQLQLVDQRDAEVLHTSTIAAIVHTAPVAASATQAAPAAALPEQDLARGAQGESNG